MNVEALEKATDVLQANVQGWEQRTIEMICKRIQIAGELSPADVNALKNITDITGDIDKLTADMASVLKINIAEVLKLYEEQLAYAIENKLPEYDFVGKSPPLLDNDRLKAIAKAFAKTTGETMINLSATKAISIISADGLRMPLKGAYQSIIDKAVYAVTNGLNFNAEMSNVIKQLGGGGARVNYGGGVTRRLDTVIRSNILYGAKQASRAYDDELSEELGCDGFEVDFHVSPRPTHEDMGGKQFANGNKSVTVKGKTYPPGTTALSLLDDYGCLHDKRGIFLGISKPAYSDAELKKLKAADKELIEYNGQEKTPYEWKQEQRKLETAMRYQKDVAVAQKAAGELSDRKATQARLNSLQAKYDEMIEAVGGQETYERALVAGYAPVVSK